ncbi:hypothetical protein BS47DRAFT_1392695 [Hydnum rufescens UP504]|uniref:Uncharacterized protein n=1 Tax=Hydnum rufescens UP504 TaxID=1448309 RepID=A0A9P6AYC0_9AGAM|nr:hypothetical protein BS47DRAFT_1392695 [Hydnum rufescens UP504]
MSRDPDGKVWHRTFIKGRMPFNPLDLPGRPPSEVAEIHLQSIADTHTLELGPLVGNPYSVVEIFGSHTHWEHTSSTIRLPQAPEDFQPKCPGGLQRSINLEVGQVNHDVSVIVSRQAHLKICQSLLSPVGLPRSLFVSESNREYLYWRVKKL